MSAVVLDCGGVPSPFGERRVQSMRCAGRPAIATAVAAALAAALAPLAEVGIARAQAVDPTPWVANGAVRAVVRDGGTIYLGGDFTKVGPATGGALPLDAVTGLPQGVPNLAGQAFAVAPDGVGGWYVGGSFTHVGGVPRLNLARIRADHGVSDWNPGADGAVRALAVGGGVVYAGGEFTNAGGQPRNHVAAIDSASGLATAWNPDADNAVLSLVASGGTVYAGGLFTQIGGGARNRVAALSATTGAAAVWPPGANGAVNALALSGNTLYVAGQFTSIGDSTRNRIVALNATTGAPSVWNPNANGLVFTVAVGGGAVYVGGGFTSVGGVERFFVAKLDSASGLPEAWNPTGANGMVRSLAVGGGAVHAGGDFSVIGLTPRNRIAALDATSGAVTPWDPNADLSVHALAVDGDKVIAGGAFSSVGGQTRNRIAALDAATGAVTAWNPEANAPVWALAVRGNTVFAGGEFDAIGGETRTNLAALDAATGFATAWNPDATGDVNALALSGNLLYAGGFFEFIGGEARNKIAALDVDTGAATSWDPGASSDVFALAVDGATIYAGGQFGSIGGAARLRIAALDSTTGLATAWNPGADNTVWALAASGDLVYAGGAFTTIGGEARDRIAALDATTGLATAWNPGANAEVLALAATGTSVYAGGSFGAIGGAARARLARLDAATGLALAWAPEANAVVHTLRSSHGVVYAGGEFTVAGGGSRAGLAAIAQAPEIAAIAPDRGGTGGEVTIAIAGEAFQAGSVAMLTGAARADTIVGATTVAVDGRSLTTTLDLDGADIGPWDAVVATPDAQAAVRADGFTVEDRAPYEVRVNVLGPELMRANRRKAFDLVLENLGNGDALTVPLWVSGIPSEATVEPDFALAAPPQAGGEPDWSTAPLTFEGPDGRYLALVIPRLPPGITVRRVYLTVPGSVASFDLTASLAPPWTDSDAFRTCLAGSAAFGDPACVGSQLAAIDAHLAATPGIEALSGIALWAKVAWQCEGAATLAAALATAEQALDFMLQPLEGPVPADCEVSLVARWQDRRRVTIVSSVDPNEKIGPGGVGPARQVGGDRLLPYTIRFENLESASAPAQEVLVIDALDLATLDVTTVSLGPITFGDRTVVPPLGLTSFTTEVDLRPERDLIVRVGAGLDDATGIVTWSFASIDPATGLAPEDPLAGFLPANATPPEGEGSVLFTVLPKQGLAGGTSIANDATLVFDGVPLTTSAWSNVLDATAPESAMLPLPPVQDSTSFTVRWEAAGPPPDLHDYSVYVSEDGGPYRPWRVHVTATADTITAPGGRTYAFYSLARDSSGNLEDVPGAPDVETFSRVAVDAAVASRLALEGAAPNPSIGGVARVWFTLPGVERAVLEVVDVAGRRVLRREVGSLGPGRHGVDVSGAFRRPGLYFVRLAQGGRALHARVAVVR